MAAFGGGWLVYGRGPFGCAQGRRPYLPFGLVRIRSDVLGKWFAVRPNSAVFKVFFLPDGDGALESVDEPATRVECGGAMRRSDDDENTGFADFDPPQAVHDCGVANLKVLERSGNERSHFL